MSLRVLSTFSGISAASAAWQPQGFEMIGYCEPAWFPAYVLHQRLGATKPKYLPEGREFAAKHYAGIDGGRVVNFGDVEQITDEDLLALGRVDVLEGGSPCQSFSVAGLRGGLGDHRGNLAFAFVELAARMRRINGLRFVIWENVLGVLSHADNPLGCLLAALAGAQHPLLSPRGGWPNSGHMLVKGQAGGQRHVSAAWRVLNAQHFGVSQRRNRIFLVASFDDDVDAGQVLFEQAGEGRDPASCCGSQQDGSEYRPERVGTVTALLGMDSDCMVRVNPEAAFALKASNSKNVQVVIHPRRVGTLCASGAGTARTAGQANELDFVIIHDRGEGEGRHGYACRRLTPLECERLQGFKDGWTDITIAGKPVTDGHRYKAIGNSIAVPCLSFIGGRLLRAVEVARNRDIQEAA